MKAQLFLVMLALVASALGMVGCDKRTTNNIVAPEPDRVVYTASGTVAQVEFTNEVQLIDSSKPLTEIGAVTWQAFKDGIKVSSGFAEGGAGSIKTMVLPGPGRYVVVQTVFDLNGFVTNATLDHIITLLVAT